MNTAMKKYTVLAILASMCGVPALAQNALPSRTLTIEGSFNPQATQAGKIMPVPDKPRLKPQDTKVSYLTDTPSETTRLRQPMAVFSTVSDDVEPETYQGVVRFGYGLRNLHDGILDFGWRMSDRDFLKVAGQMDGWSSEPDGDWRSNMFNTGLKVDYKHRFDSFEVGADAGYSHTSFNYRPGEMMDSAMMAASMLTQRINRADVSLNAEGRSGDVSWNASVTGLWLLHDHLIMDNVAGDDRKESQLRSDFALSMPMLDGTAGVDVSFRRLSYDWSTKSGKNYVNSSSLAVSPFWSGSISDMDLYLGMNLNLHTRIGHRFLASPMARMTYHLRDDFSVLAGLTGGLIENDIRALESISPYFSNEEQIKDGYTLVNMSAGVQYEQGTWLTLTGNMGYRRTLDEVFQVAKSGKLVTSALKQQNSNVLYVKINADMQFTDRTQVRFDFTYNNYMGQYPGRKMELKPAFDMSLYSRAGIAKGLDAMLTYRLMLFNWIDGVAMPSVNDLALTLDYDLNKDLSLYVTANKLAGGNYYYYAGYRALEPAFILGATYRF